MDDRCRASSVSSIVPCDDRSVTDDAYCTPDSIWYATVYFCLSNRMGLFPDFCGATVAQIYVILHSDSSSAGGSELADTLADQQTRHISEYRTTREQYVEEPTPWGQSSRQVHDAILDWKPSAAIVGVVCWFGLLSSL